MIKKVLFLSLIACFVFVKNGMAQNASAEAIFKKCSFLSSAKDVKSDIDIGKYIDKENDCLLKEVKSLIIKNVKDSTHRNKILKDLDAAEKSTYDLFWTTQNFNEGCKVTTGVYDCGTASRYYMADSRVQEILKIYVKMIVAINNGDY